MSLGLFFLCVLAALVCVFLFLALSFRKELKETKAKLELAEDRAFRVTQPIPLNGTIPLDLFGEAMKHSCALYDNPRRGSKKYCKIILHHGFSWEFLREGEDEKGVNDYPPIASFELVDQLFDAAGRLVKVTLALGDASVTYDNQKGERHVKEGR